MKQSYEYYHNKISNNEKLDSTEYRTFNRYYLHNKSQRLCSTCLIIFTDIHKNFNIKRYHYNYDRELKTRHTSYETTCRTCRSIHNLEYRIKLRSNIPKFMKQFIPHIKSRAKELCVPFDMTSEYLENQLRLQENKCFYTNEILDFTVISELRNQPHKKFPSLDRKNPSLGYVKGNVVWCLYEINRMKSDMTYFEFIDTCSLILSVNAQDQT